MPWTNRQGLDLESTRPCRSCWLSVVDRYSDTCKVSELNWKHWKRWDSSPVAAQAKLGCQVMTNRCHNLTIDVAMALFQSTRYCIRIAMMILSCYSVRKHTHFSAADMLLSPLTNIHHFCDSSHTAAKACFSVLSYFQLLPMRGGSGSIYFCYGFASTLKMFPPGESIDKPANTLLERDLQNIYNYLHIVDMYTLLHNMWYNKSSTLAHCAWGLQEKSAQVPRNHSVFFHLLLSPLI